ncbi:DUF397 domain-containing protein [Streptomyces chitinivorans]|uniref:DUF397 domain-containing protein n=1 Tax=Streptomyces chitinivorans TaxID=1257027 RepID=A0ABW7HPR3_9ACTN|nr:DUF397 domain-containing protein [Streptomyces chitinivorans]MDH2410635.1 DUF397 domain-containing protein [Streptomyces chitinivorans]
MLENTWQKSSFCGGNGGNNCVELRSDAGAIRLRESERPGQTIATTPAALRALILSAKAGELDHLAC